MKRVLMLAICVAGAVLALPTSPARASWVSTHCGGSHSNDSYVKRSEAQAYSAVAAEEGYEWGGGCWNNNDVDDTPYAPDSTGEGADCSGLTFKAWEMKNTMGRSGFEYWSRLYNVHGPYSSYDYHSPASSDPFYKLSSKSASTTMYMDAFAKNGHIGMLYIDQPTSDGLDLMIEALGDRAGMGKFYESYRSQSEYVGVRREGWTIDCYPSCVPYSSPVVVP